MNEAKWFARSINGSHRRNIVKAKEIIRRVLAAGGELNSTKTSGSDWPTDWFRFPDGSELRVVHNPDGLRVSAI